MFCWKSLDSFRLFSCKQSYSSLSKGKADIYLVDKQDNKKSELGDEFESIRNDFVFIKRPPYKNHIISIYF